MACHHTDQPTKRRATHRIGEKMRTAENSARGNRYSRSDEDPTPLGESDRKDRGDRHCRRGMSGWKRIPSTATEGREIDRPGVDELRPGPADCMFDEVAQRRDNAMSHQSLPSRKLHVRTFEPDPGEQDEQADRHQGFPPAEPIADVAERCQPGVWEIPDGVVQRPHKLRQGNVEFEQTQNGQRDGRT